MSSQSSICFGCQAIRSCVHLYVTSQVTWPLPPGAQCSVDKWTRGGARTEIILEIPETLTIKDEYNAVLASWLVRLSPAVSRGSPLFVDLPQVVFLCSSCYEKKNERRSQTNERRSLFMLVLLCRFPPHWTPTKTDFEKVYVVWALAGNIVLCSWARHFTLTVPLSTQVYKWIPAKLISVSQTVDAIIGNQAFQNERCHICFRPGQGGNWL